MFFIFSLVPVNAKANVSLSGQIIKKHGEDYLHYHKMTIKIKVVTGKLRLDNLFGGEPVLGEVINSAINANFEQFMNELATYRREGFSEVHVGER
ncbi:protein takeout-like [Homalodisca vitripennis]|uniref:protein takeout-like n=1 Tax=Homalodisca vitripennis TaxID=197043 RepID=UPI001EEA8D42|nr:protein takeout-like [Homalodisca vitripennis]